MLKKDKLSLIIADFIMFIYYMITSIYTYLFQEKLKHITNLSHLKSIDNRCKITAPYTILSKTQFTPNLDIYGYQNYLLKILNKNNPDKIIFQIIRKNEPEQKTFESNNASTNEPLPWWSNTAPKILKNLDFSIVDGNQEKYHLAHHHRLQLLSTQGYCGLVYVLEHSDKNSKVNIICAVKLLFTRPDRNITPTLLQEEIKNNLKLDNLKFNIAIQPYGIVQNDPNHYLLFLEYAQNARFTFKSQDLNSSIKQILIFIEKVNKFHADGYIHGDLKVANTLFVEGQMKLCDWGGLKTINQLSCGVYRYFGSYLPPEAMRAGYFFDNDKLLYSFVIDKKKQTYFLHPVASDRFCLGVSLLEIIAPDLYTNFNKFMPKHANRRQPDALDFWDPYVRNIQHTQKTLLFMAAHTKNKAQVQVLKQVNSFIEIDPLKRKTL